MCTIYGTHGHQRVKFLDNPEPRSYRPICLLSALGKVLEARLGAIYGAFADTQHGFVRNRGVDSAWLSVQKAMLVSTAKYLLGAFVDFRGAFDNLE